jgi:hypothetical protein
MTRWLTSLLPLILAGAEPAASPWLTNYRQALEAARAENKPVFVVFRCEH